MKMRKTDLGVVAFMYLVCALQLVEKDEVVR